MPGRNSDEEVTFNLPVEYEEGYEPEGEDSDDSDSPAVGMDRSRACHDDQYYSDAEA